VWKRRDKNHKDTKSTKIINLLCVLCVFVVQPVLSQTKTPWKMELAKERQARTTVNVINRCFTAHVFEVEKSAEMAWFNFAGEPKLEVPAGETRTLGAQIDTTGLEVGLYEGEVLVKCADCKRESGCSQDREILSVRLKVLWSAQELESLSEDQFVPKQILVILNADQSSVITKTVQELEARYRLRRVKTLELRSISKVIVLFSILDPKLSVALAVKDVQTDPVVLFAQPNFLYRTYGERYNDPYEGLQYGPQKIRAADAHKYSTGKDVKIAIVDTGIDYDHVDLKGRIIERANFVEGDKEFTQDVHGTLMAGIIAAIPNNGIGIYGVAPGAKIMAVKVCKPRARNSVEAESISLNLAQGLDFATLKGARIINLSLGGPKDPLISRLVDRAFALGIVLVAAAGNDGPQGRPGYPAALEKVITVSAIDIKDEQYELANRGDYIDLVAPGVEILSTLPGNRYNPFTGTSMAAAHVTGVIAIILEKSDLLPEEIKSLLESTAIDLGAPGRDSLFGLGCVDAFKALTTKTQRARRE
jgi:hypothetical protein